MSFYSHRKVLVTGGTGLIGIPLVNLLAEQGVQVTVAANRSAPCKLPAKMLYGDLTDRKFVQKAMKGQEMVFHLAGTKTGVGSGREHKVDLFVPQLLFNTLIMDAAFQERVERYLFCSSIGVYGEWYELDPGSNEGMRQAHYRFTEDQTAINPPSEANQFQGWAKRMGELQAQAYKESYDWDKIAIARIANTYGPWDTFTGPYAMVVPSLIHRAYQAFMEDKPWVVWGDGSPVRDFIYSQDAAQGLALMMEKAADCQPLNLGSGSGVSIKDLVSTIMEVIPGNPTWDTSKPSGAAYTVLDTTLMEKKLQWRPQMGLFQGIVETADWYRRHIGKSR